MPISLIASFTVLLALGLSINMLTLLALVMAIGLVVDDAIVVLENIHRRIEEYGETPLVAAYRGTRQVGFAVVATTLVLIAVFVPITFMQGQMGRLFSEFAIAIAAAIAFSMLVALTISPMMASKLLKPHSHERRKGRKGFAYSCRPGFRRPAPRLWRRLRRHREAPDHHRHRLLRRSLAAAISCSPRSPASTRRRRIAARSRS